MMNSIFQELLHEGVLANYMDNFVILAKTIKELEERMVRFLKIAEKHNLCFKRSKCDFNIEDTGKDQRCGKLSQVCKLLSVVYPKFQPYNKAIKQIKRQERLEIGRRTSEGI